MATKKKMLQAAAGQAGGAGGAVLNVEDVFSTYLYEGNGGSQIIQNGINLGQSFGSGSVKFSDGSSDWIVSQSSSEFAFGTGDFTLECWVYRTSDTGSTNNLIDLRESDNTENKPSLAIDSSDKVAYYSNGSWRTVGTTSVPIGQWVHLAVVRSSGTTKVYYNGTAEGTAFSDSYNYSASTVANIGGAWSGDFDLDGYIAEARISDTARYTANFTTPTAPFSSDANTVLLTCKGADPFVDNSPNAFTITQNGNPQATTFGPFDAAEAGEGGMVWFKARTSVNSHILSDTERGANSQLRSDTTDTASTSTTRLTSFNSNGFSIGSSSTVNTSTNDYASWTFRKAPKFFTCLTYTGTGSAQNISHDLGSDVGFLLIKRTDSTSNWRCWHRGLPGTGSNMEFNQTGAYETATAIFNGTDPTSTQFSVGTNSNVNASGGTYVAYIFAHNDGNGEFGPDGDQDIIKCGSYTLPASGEVFVDLGFEPQWVLFKQTDGSGHWHIVDNMRGFTNNNAIQPSLRPNESSAETDAGLANLFSTGFGRSGFGVEQDYIYMAIRRGPLAQPESGTEVFAPVATDQTNNPQSGFPVDLWWLKARNGPELHVIMDRMRGTGKYLSSDSTAAEGTNPSDYYRIDNMTGGFSNGGSYSQYIHWLWKRAPGFFDVVAYTGDGVAGRTVSHNLGVTPEMMWVKMRSGGTAGWGVYHKDIGATNYLNLNNTNASAASVWYWNNTTPTESVFTLGGGTLVNLSSSYNYIAYLFATLPGISKVGSYTGTGATLNIDCGFTSGARFVLIKRTNNQSPWWVWDSERGIIAGNDPWLELNSTAAEVTNTDYIDPYSAGFTLTSGGNWLYGMNYPSGEYIFYAIA